MYPNQLDGYLQDRVEYDQSWLVPEYAKSIGYAGTMEEFDASWKLGIGDFIDTLRAGLGGKALLANSFGAFYKKLNGTVYESFPGNWSDTIPETYDDWSGGERPYALGEEGYINVSQSGYTPNYTLAETYELESMPDGTANNPFGTDGWSPNYQRMRLGITSALLGDGYFSYEIATWGHGNLGLFWFDEYDNGGVGQGYLGQPTSGYYEIENMGSDGKAFRRDFDNGIVICNPSTATVTYNLGSEFRHIKGRQVPSINSGELTTSVTLAPRDGVILLKKNISSVIQQSGSISNKIRVSIVKDRILLSNTQDFTTISLYSLSGREIISQNIAGVKTVQLSSSSFAAGNYIIRLSGKTNWIQQILQIGM